ncbi:MAG: HigA family addiction module antidote protein [Gomphosphaeria aponina SAG 52.96 = DSM 107014]|uniref:HigA family addiction module antidote protein n=1 Tax=Gomphosphaeria aponina SAG 52.96 = DSM 107014 TaxID=1521640 RepID=A0A941JTR6_9CHRO|nr:HigA family addiction module antidote protein [Gomphosphaeria aponina SAG 52.96 = DSM 107014]
MTNKLIPARIVTPGDILTMELEARGWTQKDLAEIMDRPAQTINAIINAKKEITPETAIELAAAFDIPAEFWTNLETNYRLHLAKKNDDHEAISRRRRLYELVPLSELIKKKWLPQTKTLEELETAVCDFLNITSPTETPQLAVNFRHNHSLEPEDTALIAWLKRVEHLAKVQSVGKFDPEELKSAIPEILSYAHTQEDITKVPPLLMSLGVHFVIVPHLSKTYLDGATFTMENHPVIALTLRYNRIDSFWFTLMHELAHIIAGHEGIYLDDLKKLEDNPQEKEANQLSCHWLIDTHAFGEFVATHSSRFSTKAIEQFAASQQRHPGIIVGRLHYEGKISYKNHRKYLVKIDKLLT